MERNVFSSQGYNDKSDPFIPYEHFFNDIDTPLSAMYISIQRLESGNLRKEMVNHHVESIKHNWFQVMKAINDACDGQRLLNGTLLPVFCNYDIVALVKDIAHRAGLLSERRNIRLEFLCNSEPCTTAIDKKILERIILNLLSCAFRRTEESGKVRMEMRLDGENIVISVKDAGQLVPDYLMVQITAMLRGDSEDSPTQPLPKGFLWLYIVRGLTTLIGADLTFISDEYGLTAALSFPIVTANETEAEWSFLDEFYNDNIYQFELTT